MNISTRPATQADLAALCELNRDVQAVHHTALPWLFKPPLDKHEAGGGSAYFAALIAHINSRIIIALFGEKSVGYVYFEIRERAETELTYAHRSLLIHHISIKPEFQRSGIGRALMAAVDSIACELNTAMVQVDFWNFNDGARAFYKGLGFSPCNERYWRLRQPASTKYNPDRPTGCYASSKDE
ncbi:MAG: GNAT family N-acetyltransferase [Alphaproteobacteria bacterium]|nr:GNAT family N-acetyltransferase [Alphaproteobacteria bacterium]MDE2495232.1 GNAT family N-acetyltransferase [Alphaproteobacteria bacterium]MDE2499956.1 GNAT family N-acetyltransferase [Alphaproteobacteria bacterium]